MRYILLCLLFISTAVVAVPMDASIICENNFYQYKGIKCCLEDVTISQCKEIIDIELPKEVINRVQIARQMISDGMFDPGYNPNCHDTTIAYNFPNLVPTPHILLDDQLIEIMEANYRSINQSQLQHGDMVLFYFYARERVYQYDNQKNRFVGTFKGVEGINHTATYLSNGFVFQAESAFTRTYTIASVEMVQRAMKLYMNSSKFSQIRIELEYYSPQKRPLE